MAASSGISSEHGAIIAPLALVGSLAAKPMVLFESENLVAGCLDAGFTFGGPAVHSNRAMGSKIESEIAMIEAGVPVVPGRVHALEHEDGAVKAA